MVQHIDIVAHQHSDGLPTQLAMYQTPKKIKAHCLPLPSSGANGKAKMHELYTLWLSCKGIWAECSLVIKATKSKSQDAVETYDLLGQERSYQGARWWGVSQGFDGSSCSSGSKASPEAERDSSSKCTLTKSYIFNIILWTKWIEEVVWLFIW